MTKTLLIYDRPAILSRDRHRHVHLDTSLNDMRYASTSNSFLLAATELPDAALHYPTVFIGPEGGPYTLAVLVGLRDGQNLFVGSEGHWEQGAYIPAFVRRYPFVLSQDDNSPGGEFDVCIDENHRGFSGLDGSPPAPNGQPLFLTDGTNAPLLDAAINYLKQFNAEMKRTRDFAAELDGFGLLEKRHIEVRREGNTSAVEGFRVVSEPRIAELKANQIKRLAEKGYLALAYAHILSMRQVQRLAAREA